MLRQHRKVMLLSMMWIGGLVVACLIGSQPSISAADSPTPMRPGVAPPATRTALTIVTPKFAANVPLPRTGHFDSAQLTLGRTVYTQWCATCHGDQGQGLDLWRSSWDTDHQTCTKSGCHGRNAPPDGFVMLKVAPPLMGLGTLQRFPNALALYTYVRYVMPYQAPGTLNENEYWAVTAFLADQHQANAAGKMLDAQNALDILLSTP